MTPQKTYQVIVGNIGTVLTTDSVKEARHVALIYIKQSSSGVGRAGGEDVTIMCDGGIFSEYIGTLSAVVNDL